MLGLVGAVVAEGQTGISWVDAGKVLNEQPSYLGFDINVPVTTLVAIETLSMGFAEVKRSSGAYPPRVSNQRPLPGRHATLPNNAVFHSPATSVETIFQRCDDDDRSPD